MSKFHKGSFWDVPYNGVLHRVKLIGVDNRGKTTNIVCKSDLEVHRFYIPQDVWLKNAVFIKSKNSKQKRFKSLYKGVSVIDYE